MKFRGEDLFFGGTTPYRTYPTAVGTTFSLRTFVTTVLHRAAAVSAIGTSP